MPPMISTRFLLPLPALMRRLLAAGCWVELGWCGVVVRQSVRRSGGSMG